jgi:hypothetical protein
VQKTLTGHAGPVTALACAPRGRRLASGSEDRTIKLWDPVAGQVHKTLTGHTRAIRSLIFLDEDRLVSTDFGNTANVWSIATGKLILTAIGGEMAPAPRSGWDQFWSRTRVATATSDGRLILYQLQAQYPPIPIALGALGSAVTAMTGAAGYHRLRARRLRRRRLQPIANRVATFFQKADCSIVANGVEALTIRHGPPTLDEFAPVTVRLCLDGAPERDDVSGLGRSVQRAARSLALLVYRDPPGPATRAEFPAVWAEHHVSILPLELHAIEQQLTLAPEGCWTLLDTTLKTYGPGADLFANTGQITDSLVFFGRLGLLNQMRADLVAGQAVGLFGLRKAGKTSVLNHLTAALGEFPVVKLDLEGRDPSRFGAEISRPRASASGSVRSPRGWRRPG